MRKFNAVFKEKQAISEQVLETKLLKQFKAVYTSLLEQYATTEFHDLNEETQVAFLRELNKYWTEEAGLSEKGINFLEHKSALLTESSTQEQKQVFLRDKATIVISETLRQADIKNKLYTVLDEMFKSTKSEDIAEVLPTEVITGSILESFGAALQELMTEMVYELSPEEDLNEEDADDEAAKWISKPGLKNEKKSKEEDEEEGKKN